MAGYVLYSGALLIRGHEMDQYIRAQQQLDMDMDKESRA
jgi:hypothetical protein